MVKEINPRGRSRRERLIEEYIQQVEMGKETLIARIQQTLDLDSETRPTREQIAAFVKLQLQPKKPRHARKQY